MYINTFNPNFDSNFDIVFFTLHSWCTMCYTKATTLYISYLLLTLTTTDKIQACLSEGDCHEHHGKEQTPIPPVNI